MLYNKVDTLLLAEGMSAFRAEVHSHFGLDGKNKINYCDFLHGYSIWHNSFSYALHKHPADCLGRFFESDKIKN